MFCFGRNAICIRLGGNLQGVLLYRLWTLVSQFLVYIQLKLGQFVTMFIALGHICALEHRVFAHFCSIASGLLWQTNSTKHYFCTTYLGFLRVAPNHTHNQTLKILSLLVFLHLELIVHTFVFKSPPNTKRYHSIKVSLQVFLYLPIFTPIIHPMWG
jgi:hypothetical protein